MNLIEFFKNKKLQTLMFKLLHHILILTMQILQNLLQKLIVCLVEFLHKKEFMHARFYQTIIADELEALLKIFQKQ